MKKLHTSAMLAAAAAFVASPILGVTNASAAATVAYKDYSELNRNTLNNTFSYSRIYYTENTKITAAHVGVSGIAQGSSTTTADTQAFSSGRINRGESYTLLIENSTAADPNGQPLDVLYKVSNVNPWTNELNDDGTTKAYSSLNITKGISGSNAALHPEESAQEVQTIKAGDPIVAWIGTTRADAIFTVEFCKKGTYVASSDSCTLATNMKSVSSAMWDFDVPNRNRNTDGNGDPIVNSDGWYDYQEDGDKYFHGNEGIMPSSGTNTIYMNKNSAIDGMALSTEQNGLSVKDMNGAAFDGIWYGNSIMATATGLSGSWSFRYSGRGCGVGFIFGSAVPYAMPKPKKTVNKTQAKVGDTVTYRISQEVPNNYSGEADIVTFMNLWSRYDAIPQNKGYSALKISDSLDDSLSLPATSNIKIFDEKNNDVTSQFTIAIDGQKLTATAKNASNFDFYGHTYTIVVNATVKTTITGSPVQNLAQTSYTPVDGSETTLPSDPVETKIYHTVVVKYINDETGKEIADPTSEDYEHGKSYVTDESEDIPEKFVLIEIPDNASGTVDHDIEVIYRYLPPKKVTARYIDDETGKPIGDPISDEYPQGDDYETSPLPDDPNGYKLVKTPDNAKGSVGNKDIEVIYRYRKVKNPNTADISMKTFVGAIVASVMGGGLLFGLKRRR
jgi:fimbrial isopeptide formation D2 family protein